MKRPAIRRLALLLALACLVVVRAAPAFPVAIMGDSRNDVHGILPMIVDKASGVPDLRFAVHLGDMTGGASEKEFAHYRQVVSKLKVPVFSIPGNHDVGGTSSYEKQLGKPYYSHREGKWRFIFIDNSRRSLGKRQLNWIKTELESGTKAEDYIVLAMHKPLCCPAAGGHIMESPDRQTLLGLAERYHVELVLAAHYHSYARILRNGVEHLTTGGAGAPLVGVNSHFHYIQADFHDDGTFFLQYVKVK